MDIQRCCLFGRVSAKIYNSKLKQVGTSICNKIVIIHQGREDIFLSRGSLFPEKRASRGIKKRGLKLSSLPWCIYYFKCIPEHLNV
jgi:hypothetical protein